MEKKSKPAEMLTCPIVRSAALLGDEWVLLVLRALFRGAHKFDELQKERAARKAEWKEFQAWKAEKAGKAQ